MRSQRLKNESGVSLVEFAIAGTLLSVALMATTSSVFSGAGLDRAVSQKLAVTRAATSILEDVRTTDFEDVVDTFNGTSHPVTLADGTSGTVDVVVFDADPGATRWPIHGVRLSFTPAAGEPDSALSFTTFVCDRTTGSGFTAPAPALPLVSAGDGELLGVVTAVEEDVLGGAETSPGESSLDGSGGDESSSWVDNLYQLIVEITESDFGSGTSGTDSGDSQATADAGGSQ